MSKPSLSNVPAPTSDAPALTAAELAAEGRGPGLTPADIQKMIAEQVAAATKSVLEANQTLKKELAIAQEKAAPFYTHMVGGRDGVDPREDQSIKVSTLPNGQMVADIRVYLNKIPKQGSAYNARVVNADGTTTTEKRYNWDLGRTMIRESLVEVPVTQGGKTRTVTLSGLAVINIGADSESIEERIEARERAAGRSPDANENGLPQEVPSQADRNLKANQMESNPSA